jgi:hypothetical protein
MSAHSIRFTRSASAWARAAGSGTIAPIAAARSTAPTTSCSDPFAAEKWRRLIPGAWLGRPSHRFRKTDFAARIGLVAQLRIGDACRMNHRSELARRDVDVQTLERETPVNRIRHRLVSFAEGGEARR